MELGMHVMTSGPISTAYVIDPSHQCVCMYVYPSIVAKQRLCEAVTAATNISTTIEYLLNSSSFYMYFVAFVNE